MRITECTTNCNERDFSNWVLQIGDGVAQSGVQEDHVVVPSMMLLATNTLQELIAWVYKDICNVANFDVFFKDRAILAPRNKDVDMINQLALGEMLEESKTYLSADSVCSSDQGNFLYNVEFLNSVNLGGGYPPHALHLKKNAPIILLRNLNPRQGLCNGTRLICKQFCSRLIEAEIITGTHIGQRVFIPRITFIASSSAGLPFEMRRRQFPLKLAFGMTINKAQGQTLGIMGLYLTTPIFSHGQLYVAMSRVRSSDAVKIVINGCSHSEQSEGVVTTLNVVYKEVLQMTNRQTT